MLGGIDVNALRDVPRCDNDIQENSSQIKIRRVAQYASSPAYAALLRYFDRVACSALVGNGERLNFRRLGADLRLHCVESSDGFAKLDRCG